MVYLRLIKVKTGNWNITEENIIMINTGETSIVTFKEVKIQKSNGSWYTFKVFLSDALPKGYMALRDIGRQTYRFHLNNTYWVEGHVFSVLRKNPTVDVRKIGILGQDEAIDDIMWSVFEPRKLTLKTRQALNLKLVRGIVLYGPPGTGKTSMIRGICNYQQIVPNVVCGPQLLNQYIGNSEGNIRELFLKPMVDQEKFGDESPLHVVVLDEMEALFPKRSIHSGETNTRNTVVNQMLSMMDGYTPLDNYVIFGTTNRLDMIDPALLRGGRFELHIKIDLPSNKGRFDILKSLIEPLQTSARLASDVNEAVLAQIAESTINYSGAELKQLIQCASRAAIRRVITGAENDVHGKRHIDETKIVVRQSDIVGAYQILHHRRCMEENKDIGDKD